MKPVIVSGAVVLDHRLWVDEWPPARGRTPAHAYVEDLGGSGAVAAAAVVALGGAATFLGARGDDAAGARVAALLHECRVDTRHITVRPGGRTAVSSIAIVPGGERFIMAYPGEGLCDEPGRHTDSVLDGAGAVLVDSRLPRGAATLARAARARGLPVVVDLDVDVPDVWAVVSTATHVIADLELAERTGGPEALLAKLHGAGVWGAVTLGAAGLVYAGGRVPGFAVRARDTTGAGDVFHGAFALALVEGQSIEAALVFASAAAAVRCARGRLPDRQAVAELLAAEPRRGG
jgi:sulfofructose kinase